MDTADVIKTSDVDGVHYEPEELEKLGKAVAESVLKILG